MKNIIIIIFLFLVGTLIGHGQVDFRINIENNEIGYFDPVELHATISYNGPDTMFYSVFGRRYRRVSDTAMALTTRPQFQYRHIDSTSWLTIQDSGYPRFEDIDPVSRGFTHGKRISSKRFLDVQKQLYYFPVTNDGHFVFEKPGVYLCRLFVHSFYADSIGIVSSADTVYVKKYRRRDRKLIKKLLKTEKPRFVFSYLTNTSYGMFGMYGMWSKHDSIPSLAKDVLSWKSKSKYADLAKWHMVTGMIGRREFGYNSGYTYLELRDMQLKILGKTRYPDMLLRMFHVMSIEEAEFEESRFQEIKQKI